MSTDSTSNVPPGWIGGFAPYPQLSELPLDDNMAHIDLLDRQQAVLWPEFSWETVPGEPDSRCFQMFAPDISRIGYTDTGRVYSIICPQQGSCSPTLGCMNVEVTVTGVRGWVDEPNKTLGAEMTVEGKVWFSPSANETPLVRLLWDLLSNTGLPFPSDKAHAIRVTTHAPGDPSQPVFPVRSGATTLFASPDFAQHPEAWTVGNLEVEIGPIASTGNADVDDLNHLVMDIFNTASGNLLKQGNVLTWNVWFTDPALVDRQEWQDHAEKWRESIDADHGSPDGPGTAPRYFDGNEFKPGAELGEEGEDLLTTETASIREFLRSHVHLLG